MKDANTITYYQHEAMVKALFADPTDILKGMTVEQVALLHAALGLASEVGEICSVVKRHIFYQKPLDEKDLANVMEEDGDVRFYLGAMGNTLGYRPIDAMSANMTKLSKRYPNFTFSREHALARLDKPPGE